jgi:lipoate-protein ligase B
MILHCIDLLDGPPVAYDEGHALQERVTVGRGGSEANILADTERLAAEGVQVRPVERGGDVTYHGPGQLVAYPLVRLTGRRRDLHRYLRDLEAVLIGTLAAFRVRGRRRVGLTGVWVGKAKIASIGVAVRRWITWHGIALNVDPDLSHFSLIRPCGLADVRMTSIAAVRGGPVPMREVTAALLARFLDHFGYASLLTGAGALPHKLGACS